MFGFEKIKFSRHATTFFPGSFELGVVSELFKHASAHLKRFRKVLLWWENFCQGGANETKTACFKIGLSRWNLISINWLHSFICQIWTQTWFIIRFKWMCIKTLASLLTCFYGLMPQSFAMNIAFYWNPAGVSGKEWNYHPCSKPDLTELQGKLLSFQIYYVRWAAESNILCEQLDSTKMRHSCKSIFCPGLSSRLHKINDASFSVCKKLVRSFYNERYNIFV